MILNSVYPASEILQIESMPEGRAGVWFLNWKISEKSLNERRRFNPHASYAGPGLYGLCFNDNLIYIGSYLGSGDVVSSRWWTHIGAITARGNSVHVARRSIRNLEKELGSQHPMVSAFKGTKLPDLLSKDMGNLAPFRRLKFAAQDNEIFLDKDISPEEVLQKFCFFYSNFLEIPSFIGSKNLAPEIRKSENFLINYYAPICNTTGVPKGKKPINVSSNDIADILYKELLNIYNAYS